MSYNEWQHGLISDDEYATGYMLDEMRAADMRRLEDQEEEEESEDCEGE